jgi:hypothetical protein
MNREEIENIRRAMCTLPEQSPKKNYSYTDDVSSISVKMIDFPKNPYKAIVNSVTATWGNGELGPSNGSCSKWQKITPENRFRVAFSCLTGNTLPQAQEALQFQFEVNGLTRHDFDQHCRARVGAYFCSIGSRDNCKQDSPFLFYLDIIDRMKEDARFKAKVEHWITLSKDLYEETVKEGESSWQSARVFLPQCVNHSYVFGMNFLALKGQMSRRLMACEQEGIVSLHWLIRKQIEDSFPLLASFLKPACDNAKRCVYMEGPEGMTKYFSNLFNGCGRWEVKNKENCEYKEFNKSCTDYDRLKKMNIPVVNKESFRKYSENDFNLLENRDKELFSED